MEIPNLRGTIFARRYVNIDLGPSGDETIVIDPREYGHFVFSGRVSGGTIKIEFPPGYSPEFGDEFEVNWVPPPTGLFTGDILFDFTSVATDPEMQWINCRELRGTWKYRVGDNGTIRWMFFPDRIRKVNDEVNELQLEQWATLQKDSGGPDIIVGGGIYPTPAQPVVSQPVVFVGVYGDPGGPEADDAGVARMFGASTGIVPALQSGVSEITNIMRGSVSSTVVAGCIEFNSDKTVLVSSNSGDSWASEARGGAQETWVLRVQDLNEYLFLSLLFNGDLQIFGVVGGSPFTGPSVATAGSLSIAHVSSNGRGGSEIASEALAVLRTGELYHLTGLQPGGTPAIDFVLQVYSNDATACHINPNTGVGYVAVSDNGNTVILVNDGDLSDPADWVQASGSIPSSAGLCYDIDSIGDTTYFALRDDRFFTESLGVIPSSEVATVSVAETKTRGRFFSTRVLFNAALSGNSPKAPRISGLDEKFLYLGLYSYINYTDFPSYPLYRLRRTRD